MQQWKQRLLLRISLTRKKKQPFLVKKNLKYSVSTVIASGKTKGRTPALDCPLVTETHFKLRGDPAENDADPS